MKEIKAKEGYYLTNKDRTVFYRAIKGMNVKEEDYEEISTEEAKIIMENLSLLKTLNKNIS